eukprot:scaffold133171_cov29-Tisochrysis_lutea.AAC.4
MGETEEASRHAGHRQAPVGSPIATVTPRAHIRGSRRPTVGLAQATRPGLTSFVCHHNEPLAHRPFGSMEAPPRSTQSSPKGDASRALSRMSWNRGVDHASEPEQPGRQGLRRHPSAAASEQGPIAPMHRIALVRMRPWEGKGKRLVHPLDTEERLHEWKAGARAEVPAWLELLQDEREAGAHIRSDRRSLPRLHRRLFPHSLRSRPGSRDRAWCTLWRGAPHGFLVRYHGNGANGSFRRSTGAAHREEGCQPAGEGEGRHERET